MKGKIIKGIAGFYYVHDGNNKIYVCKAKGIFRNRNMKPLVGDNVEFQVLDQENQEGNIENLLPRNNQLIRPAASNVDQAMVVFSLLHPEPNFNLLDRYLVMMNSQNIPVSICFNKADLEDGNRKDRYRSIYETGGYEMFFTSTLTGMGIPDVLAYLKHKTTVLAGPSGVGKSSLTNLIQPLANMETGSISRKIERGKHTTRHAELFCVAENTFLMDTPGFSSLHLDGLEAGALKDCFPEFRDWEEGCRFLGCVHMKEPVCGVKQALEKGAISESRYENYRLLYEELKEKRRY